MLFVSVQYTICRQKIPVSFKSLSRYLKHVFMTWTVNDISDLTDKNVIITGANSGIGYATALELARKNATVILACRNPTKADNAIKTLKEQFPNGSYKYEHLDLSDLRSVKDFAHKMVKELKKLDILILNAGIMGTPTKTLTKDGFELHMAINHFGHFALAGYLSAILIKAPNPRIIAVSSQDAGSINLDDLDYKKGFYLPMAAYGSSKLANLLFIFELNRRLKNANSKISAIAVQPGWTQTNLQVSSPDAVSSWFLKSAGTVFAQTPAKGALPTLFAATSPDAKSGGYYGPGGLLGNGYPEIIAPPAAALNEVVAKKLFDISEMRTNSQFMFK